MTRKYKVLITFGTRPEAIKLAPVVMELNRRPEWFVTKVCVTAQHREMLDQVLTLFHIQPDYDLNIMAPDQTLAQVTARAVEGLDTMIIKERPDVVLVQGDPPQLFVARWWRSTVRSKSVMLKPVYAQVTNMRLSLKRSTDAW